MPVAFGHDCVMDPWYSLGTGDMLEVASMAVHVGQLTGLDAMAGCFASVTEVPAAIMGLEGYGLEPGCRADLVVLEAAEPVEAIRVRAARLFVCGPAASWRRRHRAWHGLIFPAAPRR